VTSSGYELSPPGERVADLSRLFELQSLAATEQVAMLADGQRIPVTCSFREIEERLRFA